MDGTDSNFDGAAWTKVGPRTLVFDEHFVDANVYSGLSVDASHRQNLHEIIVGEEGVKYLRRVQELKAEVDAAQKDIREKGRLIPESVRAQLSIDEFSALPQLEDLDNQLGEAESSVRVLENAQAVRDATDFESVTLPAFDPAQLDTTLRSALADVDQVALDAVNAHFATLGNGAEDWIATGVTYAEGVADCPFCGQDLARSDLLTHYRAYFSAAYRSHCEAIATQKDSTESRFSGDRLASVLRGIDQARERANFWSDHVDFPDFIFDTESLDLSWRQARDRVLALLERKAAAPLEPIDLDPTASAAIEEFARQTAEAEELLERLVAANPQLAAAREHATQGSLSAALTRLAVLRATKNRYKPDIDAACRDYLTAGTREEGLETEKEQARDALDEHRDRVFGDYQAAINRYLDLFHADFAILKLEKSDAAGIPSTTYRVVVNTKAIPLGPPRKPAPSFKTALSSGDRNTLALAFFFAQLQQCPSLDETIVVIDDPMSSLDAGRSHTTTQEVRKLLGRTKQLIVLSHSQDLLLSIWEHRDEETTATLAIRDAPVPEESTLEVWDAAADAVTDYDRSYKLVNDFSEQRGGKASDVATELRILLEQFLRVTFVVYMPPGRMLGQFIDKAKQLQADSSPILSAEKLELLSDLNDYTWSFHHTNPSWRENVATVNEQQLRGYAKRAIEFTRMGHAPS